MKSLLKLGLIFLFIIFGLTACIAPQGPQGPQGPTGPQGPPGEGWTFYDVEYYNISRWTLAANEDYFYAEVSNSAITNDVFFNGIIVGYLVLNYEKPNEVHVPLPYDIYYNKYEDDVLLQWTETVSFEVTPGNITFYYEPSDFFTGNTPPSCMFKIVAMW